MQAANCWISSAVCVLSPFAVLAPQVHGGHAGEGAELAQGARYPWHCPAVPTFRMLKALQLKKKVVRQDKDVIHCEGETLASHRKPVASHALAETSGWPNLIKYSCCGSPNSDCESS